MKPDTAKPARRIGLLSPRAPVLMLATTLLAIACTPTTDPTQAPVTTEGLFSRSGDQPPPQQWWTSFGDPALNRAVDRALSNNFNLLSARERLAAARASADIEAAGYWPSLELLLSGRERRGDDTGDSADLALDLTADYELDLWGRVDARADAERLRAEATRADYQAAALSLSAEIARGWFRVAEARRQLALAQQQVRTNQQVLQLLENRFGTGLVRSVDILRQRQLLEATREERYAADSRLQTLEHQLAVLLGRPPRAADIGKADLPQLPPLPATGLPVDLMRRRPDVQSAFLVLQAADRELASAISDRYPRLTLQVSATSAGDSADQLFDDWVTAFGGDLLAPLFRGGALSAEVERREALKRQRLYEYGQTMLEALREVEDALILEQRQRQGLASLEQQVNLAQRSYEQLQVQYLNGAANYLDVLSALNQVQQLQRERLSARLTLVDYRIALYRALAGPLPAPATTDNTQT